MAFPRYLVRGESNSWVTFGRFIGPLALLAALFLLIVQPIASVVLAVIGGLLIVILELVAWTNRSRRAWIEVYPEHFRIIDARGERDIRDDHVHSIAYYVKNTYQNGEPNGYTRRGSLWIQGEPLPFTIENKFKLKQVDPIAPLLDRLIELLREGFDNALQHGLAIQGDGWSLNQHEFSFRRAGQAESLSLNEIAAIESREGKMGVWRKGAESPAVQFPLDGRNVWLLRLLMQSRLQTEGTENAEPQRMGRILFQRNRGLGTVVALALGSVAALIIGPLLLLGNEQGMFVAGLICIAASPILAVCSYGCLKSRFRCHEAGVYQNGISGESRLMYAEVGSFAYSATRHFHNGVYTGTNLSLRFDPLPGAKGKAIHYSTQVKNSDDDLDELRDFVAGVIARRMLGEISAGNIVPWTKNLTFHREGILYTPGGFFGKKETVLLPHARYGGWNMEQGNFYLFDTEKKGAVLTEQASQPNFYPGYFALLSLYHQGAETAATDNNAA